MRILLTNDNGFQSEALLELGKELAESGHEVVIVAPYQNNSGLGSAMTLLPEAKLEIISEGKVPVYALHGTTVDCVMIGLSLVKDVDVVISGMNYGPNLGTDVLSSATVGGAKKSLVLGVPAIAVSITTEDRNSPNVIPNVKNFVNLFNKKLVHVLSPEYLLNINFPDVPPEQVKGIMVTKLSDKGWEKHITFERQGKTVIAHIKGIMPDIQDDIDTDWFAIKNNCISITPIISDYINDITANRIKSILQDGRVKDEWER